MKTVRFTALSDGAPYRCDAPGDQSGEYYWKTDVDAELERLRADADRYQYLKSLLLGTNFAHGQTKNPVLEFELPEGARVSANLDKTIDAARVNDG